LNLTDKTNQTLVLFTAPAYLEGASQEDMAINGRCNKPIGPGGGTRRLHQKPAAFWPAFDGGEIGSTRA